MTAINGEEQCRSAAATVVWPKWPQWCVYDTRDDVSLTLRKAVVTLKQGSK